METHQGGTEHFQPIHQAQVPHPLLAAEGGGIEKMKLQEGHIRDIAWELSRIMERHREGQLSA